MKREFDMYSHQESSRALIIPHSPYIFHVPFHWWFKRDFTILQDKHENVDGKKTLEKGL